MFYVNNIQTKVARFSLLKFRGKWYFITSHYLTFVHDRLSFKRADKNTMPHKNIELHYCSIGISEPCNHK